MVGRRNSRRETLAANTHRHHLARLDVEQGLMALRRNGACRQTPPRRPDTGAVRLAVILSCTSRNPRSAARGGPGMCAGPMSIMSHAATPAFSVHLALMREKPPAAEKPTRPRTQDDLVQTIKNLCGVGGSAPSSASCTTGQPGKYRRG